MRRAPVDAEGRCASQVPGSAGILPAARRGGRDALAPGSRLVCTFCRCARQESGKSIFSWRSKVLSVRFRASGEKPGCSFQPIRRPRKAGWNSPTVAQRSKSGFEPAEKTAPSWNGQRRRVSVRAGV